MIKGMSKEARLFGIDLSQLWQRMHGQWMPFCASHFDSEVSLFCVSDQTWKVCRKGKLSHQIKPSIYKGLLLPDERVLHKELQLPSSVFNDLESVLAYQVTSLSPFPKDETVFGYDVMVSHDRLFISLVITSKQNIDAYLSQYHDSIDSYEIWVTVNQSAIRLSSLGETERESLATKKLKNTAVLILLSFSILLLLPLIPVAAEKKHLADVHAYLFSYQSLSQEAVKDRNRLVALTGFHPLIEDLQAQQWLPLRQLNNLTQALDDHSWLTGYNFSDMTLKIDGRSRNAAQLLTVLSNNPAYLSVSSTAPMVRDSSGFERFSFELVLRGNE